ncbi:MAG: membrane protein insertase YidC [Actinobacteria bacterium]|jgi:YidC/Oxa1 family membrane protein insertase|nr:membrane protein insertase YidC [Actinomycetota bacterium]
MFQAAAWLVSVFYGLVNNYAFAIALVALSIMLLITPLTLKSTKGMLEMQRLQPEMRKLQQQYKSDRQKLNEEMMKLYQEHKVNPLASCLPLIAQLPVFIIMFRVLRGLSKLGTDGTFNPSYIAKDSKLYLALDKSKEMLAFGLDLAKSPAKVMGEDFVKGIPYALMIVLLAFTFLIQQRMIASRTTSASMSATQAKVMQYLPVGFAVFQVFLPTGLVIYYFTQAVVRILQQLYITKRFYGHDGSIGRQAQAASKAASDIAKEAKGNSGKTLKPDKVDKPAPVQSKRVTPSKNRPAPSGRPQRPIPPSKRKK